MCIQIAKLANTCTGNRVHEMTGDARCVKGASILPQPIEGGSAAAANQASLRLTRGSRVAGRAILGHIQLAVRQNARPVRLASIIKNQRTGGQRIHQLSARTVHTASLLKRGDSLFAMIGGSAMTENTQTLPQALPGTEIVSPVPTASFAYPADTTTKTPCKQNASTGGRATLAAT